MINTKNPTLKRINIASHARNQFLRESLADSGKISDGDTENVSIVIAGSDGRRENISNTSKFEFIVLDNSQVPIDEMTTEMRIRRQRIIAALIGCNNNLNGEDFIEAKSTSSKTMRHFFDDQKNGVYFERLLDAEPITGNQTERILKTSQSRLQEELKDTGVRRKVSKDYRSRISGYGKIIRDGGIQRFQGNPVQHYEITPDSVKINFDREGATSSVKYSHLRVAQNSIALAMLKGLEKVSFPEIPNLMEDRLVHLRDQDAIDLMPDDISEIIDTYSFFLSQYHKSNAEGSFVLDDSDRSAFLERTNSLVDLSKQIRSKQ